MILSSIAFVCLLNSDTSVTNCEITAVKHSRYTKIDVCNKETNKQTKDAVLSGGFCFDRKDFTTMVNSTVQWFKLSGYEYRATSTRYTVGR